MDKLKNMFSSVSVEISSDPRVQEIQQKMATAKANQDYLRYSSEQTGGRVNKSKRHTKKKNMKKRKSQKKKYNKKTRKHTKRHMRKSHKIKKNKNKKIKKD
jgi:hypothetical protein